MPRRKRLAKFDVKFDDASIARKIRKRGEEMNLDIKEIGREVLLDSIRHALGGDSRTSKYVDSVNQNTFPVRAEDNFAITYGKGKVRVTGKMKFTIPIGGAQMQKWGATDFFTLMTAVGGRRAFTARKLTPITGTPRNERERKRADKYKITVSHKLAGTSEEKGIIRFIIEGRMIPEADAWYDWIAKAEEIAGNTISDEIKKRSRNL